MTGIVRIAALAAVGLAAGAGLGGCGSPSEHRVGVTATDSSCRPATTELRAGRLTFAVTNKGTKTTELYLYAAGDKVMGEVENVGPGTTRNLTATVPAGDYQLACKPGMQGSGVRTDVHVSGGAM